MDKENIGTIIRLDILEFLRSENSVRAALDAVENNFLTKLLDEIRGWLTDTVGEEEKYWSWDFTYSILEIWFLKTEDAAIFKLRFLQYLA